MANREMIRNLYDFVFESCPGVKKPFNVNAKLLCLAAIQMHPTQSPTCTEIFAWAKTYYDLTNTPDTKRATTKKATHMALSRGQAQEPLKPPIFFEIGPKVKGGEKRWTFAPSIEMPSISDLPLHLLNSSSDSSSTNSDGAMSIGSDNEYEVIELAQSMAMMYMQTSCHKYVLPELVELMAVLKPGPAEVEIDKVADIIIRYAKHFVPLGWEPAAKDEIEAFEKECVAETGGANYTIR